MLGFEKESHLNSFCYCGCYTPRYRFEYKEFAWLEWRSKKTNISDYHYSTTVRLLNQGSHIWQPDLSDKKEKKQE